MGLGLGFGLGFGFGFGLGSHRLARGGVAAEAVERLCGGQLGQACLEGLSTTGSSLSASALFVPSAVF